MFMDFKEDVNISHLISVDYFKYLGSNNVSTENDFDARIGKAWTWYCQVIDYKEI